MLQKKKERPGFEIIQKIDFTIVMLAYNATATSAVLITYWR